MHRCILFLLLVNLPDPTLYHLHLLLRQPIQIINQPINLRINNLYLPFVKPFIYFHSRPVVFLLWFEHVLHQTYKLIVLPFSVGLEKSWYRLNVFILSKSLF
uniref:Uncharacterized protein n=1 Tax=Uncultured archaeon GZfos26G2 TaxID=3386331 RepID=Q648L2_UNCAG|nr:hypothetical protein GZ37D1_12 [uncultured archaeon GZfos37D1]